LWKITQNGVDTHPIHFHLFDVQVINRVGWDGALLPPDPSELGWKETVLVNPLEHCIVAMRPKVPPVPFLLPNSVRLIDPTLPEGEVLRGGPTGTQDPLSRPITIINHKVNYGWEYAWHCHILSHEEMDMMHSMAFAATQPAVPNKPTVTVIQRNVWVTWNDIIDASHYSIERATSLTGPWIVLSANVPVPAIRGTLVTYLDAKVKPGKYFYRVASYNTVGDRAVYRNSLGFPTITLSAVTSPQINSEASVLVDSETSIPSDEVQVFDWIFGAFISK
ncbi:MAG: multicopper oxidase domain-containing protein, partial [Anaerolineae bacterium]